ncbi:ATP-binding protein [Mycoplasmatota bacterium zrk1]
MDKQFYNAKNMAKNKAMSSVQYNSVSFAIAELIDNAYEAGAKNIVIILGRFNDEKVIGVLDDGSGMSSSTIITSLGQGNSTKNRYNTGGIGRFGVGMKTSSLYLGSRLEVYSWENNNVPRYSYIDQKEIASGKLIEIPDAEPNNIDPFFDRFLSFNYRGSIGNLNFRKSGTFVLIKGVNKGPKRVQSFFDNLDDLGRIFRHQIENGLKIILVNANTAGESRLVKCIDPTMTLSKSWDTFVDIISKDDQEYEFFLECKNKGVSLFEVVLNDEKELTYFDAESQTNVTGKMKVKISRVRENHYIKLLEITDRPGNLSIGRALEDSMYIYINRSNREISSGRYGFYKVANMPQHRWWGLEIDFDPKLDNLFKVSSNKQGVVLTSKDSGVLSNGISIYELLKNEYFDKIISQIVKSNKKIASLVKEKKYTDTDISSGRKINKSIKIANKNYDVADTLSAFTVRESEPIPHYVLKDGSEHKLRIDKREIDFGLKDRSQFVNYSIENGQMIVLINNSNVYFSDFYEHLEVDQKERLMLFIYAMFKGIDRMIKDEETNRKLLKEINDNLFNFMVEMKHT